MIIASLMGGLGNQMFIYAAGYAASRRAGTGLRLDLRFFENYDHKNLPSRPYALKHFAVSGRPMTPLQRLWVTASALRQSHRRRLRLVGRLPFPRIPVIQDIFTGDDPRLHHPPRTALIAGGWQTEKLFAEYRDELLREFRFLEAPSARNAELIETIRSNLSVAVHFRRTDYLDAGTLTRPCGLDYYARALAMVKERHPAARFFIFTDDPEWVTANAELPADSTIVSHNLGSLSFEDIRLMSNCSHFIIANSTFSWWGAWLSASPDKTVIAPARWYADHHTSDADLVPETWTRI